MYSVSSDNPVVGSETDAAALRAVEASCDEFRHTHLLADSSSSSSGEPLFGLAFEARIGDAALQGVDLLDLDEHDRIKTFTVMARPVGSLMALGAGCRALAARRSPIPLPGKQTRRRYCGPAAPATGMPLLPV